MDGGLVMRLLLALVGLVVGCNDPNAPLSVEFRGLSTGELGMVVCSPRGLHDCAARMHLRHSTRAHGSVDVAASNDCAGLEVSARAACGASSGVPDRQALDCLAARGVFLDLGAHDEPARSDHPSADFVIACDEGQAKVDVIEPI
ncbi:MAG: hypothetical protein KC586_23350 [Myxococcales bacterium]|nr:hypothetical protein [Myxococcales bacterium]